MSSNMALRAWLEFCCVQIASGVQPLVPPKFPSYTHPLSHRIPVADPESHKAQLLEDEAARANLQRLFGHAAVRDADAAAVQRPLQHVAGFAHNAVERQLERAHALRLEVWVDAHRWLHAPA